MIKKKAPHDKKAETKTQPDKKESAMDDNEKFKNLCNEISTLSQDRKKWAHQDFMLMQSLVIISIASSFILALVVALKLTSDTALLTFFTMVPGFIISLERALNISIRHLKNHEAHIKLKILLSRLKSPEDTDAVESDYYNYLLEFEKSFPLGIIPKG